MSKNWQAYAQHILDCVVKLERIKARGDIAADDILYDAALRNLQTLAEATQKLPEDMKAQYVAVDWKKISAFRNVIVHNYLGDIDPVTILRVMNEDVLPLANATKHMLSQG